MPAEWEPHEATWLAWPHNRDDWPGKFAPIPWVYGEIVRKLARVERVRILVEDRDAEQSARRILKKCRRRSGRGRVLPLSHRSQSGRATTARSSSSNAAGEVAITDWRFNGWAKYDNWKQGRRRPGAASRDG